MGSLAEWQKLSQSCMKRTFQLPLPTGFFSLREKQVECSWCRCGYAGDPARNCNKYPRCIGDYQARLSGPLLDRIDLHVHVAAVSALDMTLPPPDEGSAEVAARVAAARARSTARGVRSNAELEGEQLDQYATPDEAGRKLLLQAAEKLRLSARGYTRMLRVSRTIADLAGAETVGRVHIAEALSYRLMTG